MVINGDLMGFHGGFNGDLMVIYIMVMNGDLMGFHGGFNGDFSWRFFMVDLWWFNDGFIAIFHGDF